MLRMAGDEDAHRSAAEILNLETAIAQRQWTRVESRDPQKTYNKVAFADLPKLMPGFNWTMYSRRAGSAAGPTMRSSRSRPTSPPSAS